MLIFTTGFIDSSFFFLFFFFARQRTKVQKNPETLERSPVKYPGSVPYDTAALIDPLDE